MDLIKRLICKHSSLYILLFSSICMQTGNAVGAEDEQYYRVENGKVDPDTFFGWSIFHDTCVTCHGVGGSGSEIAPDLTERIKYYTPDNFRIRVLNRYLIILPASDVGTENVGAVRDAFLAEIAKEEQQDPGGMNMPKWEANPVVKARIMNIYNYLKARSDGVLGPEHPGVLKDR
jgi:hypothetical protein